MWQKMGGIAGSLQVYTSRSRLIVISDYRKLQEQFWGFTTSLKIKSQEWVDTSCKCVPTFLHEQFNKPWLSTLLLNSAKLSWIKNIQLFLFLDDKSDNRKCDECHSWVWPQRSLNCRSLRLWQVLHRSQHGAPGQYCLWLLMFFLFVLQLLNQIFATNIIKVFFLQSTLVSY